MTRSVFYGFGAFVGSLTGRTSCGFWPDFPDLFSWDQAKLVPVDLGKNPEAARRGLIKVDEIQADDFSGYCQSGLTQIGPMYPSGKMVGLVGLEEDYWNKLGASKPPIPTGTGFEYEYKAVVYWDGPLAGRRFVGLHAEVVSIAKGTDTAAVAIWTPGTGQTKSKPFGTFWIDFGKDVHPVEPGFTTIELSRGTGQLGALFVDSIWHRAALLPPPKAPHAAGGVADPRRRRIAP